MWELLPEGKQTRTLSCINAAWWGAVSPSLIFLSALKWNAFFFKLNHSIPQVLGLELYLQLKLSVFHCRPCDAVFRPKRDVDYIQSQRLDAIRCKFIEFKSCLLVVWRMNSSLVIVLFWRPSDPFIAVRSQRDLFVLSLYWGGFGYFASNAT